MVYGTVNLAEKLLAMALDRSDDLMDRLASPSKHHAESKTKSQKSYDELLQQKQELLQKQSNAFLEDLFKQNNTKPIKIRNVQITNAQGFRDSFLQSQFKNLTSNSPITLGYLLSQTDLISKSFIKLGLVENLMVSYQPLRTNSPTTTLVPIFNIIPIKKFSAKTGTNIGNGEGDGYIQFQFKNIFGGGENLMFDAVSGTKTSSSYLVNYNQPLFNKANYIIENSIFMNTRKFDWINSEVNQKGSTTRIYTQYDKYINHELTFENVWKILNNKSSKSNDVIYQSGSNFKSSIIYNWTFDSRNNKHLPTKGKFLRFGLEFNGLSKLVKSRFIKSIFETQFTYPLKNHQLILSNKSGLLFSLQNSSHILDRFFIGGPNDVRSFTLNGLGPKSYNSSIGGDVFLNGGLSLISPIPFLKNNLESGFRLHNFINYGKLLPIDNDLVSTLSQFNSAYSVSAGFGLLFNHPMARFELNFILPLTIHERDSVRKGFQYGIGVSFL